MKKKDLKNLKLNKKFISKLEQSILVGGSTCESPCQDGTGCCVVPCYSRDGGRSCGWLCNLFGQHPLWSSPR